eukprot:CAMPEP_0198590226 /NCGR_PEP_ID=MMETSP1462-20131121/135419_1 /TAXON_ID=1333877 /ORGANISM="Brandtodinium nutriculum, Strain RCC3387" /LENGTH=148 /DNA_ID=CAMNT_0044321761 /DNA_START=131 /DNA_END=575 /DNA_ORIENTATION=-
MTLVTLPRKRLLNTPEAYLPMKNLGDERAVTAKNLATEKNLPVLENDDFAAGRQSDEESNLPAFLDSPSARPHGDALGLLPTKVQDHAATGVDDGPQRVFRRHHVAVRIDGEKVEDRKRTPRGEVPVHPDSEGDAEGWAVSSNDVAGG